MYISKKQFTPKKIIVGLIPLILVCILIWFFSCENNGSKLTKPSSLDSDCFEMAVSEIEYSEKFTSGEWSANDAFVSIETICTDEKLSKYYTNPEDDICDKISDLKLAVKNAMYVQGKEKYESATREVVVKSITKLRNAILELE